MFESCEYANRSFDGRVAEAFEGDWMGLALLSPRLRIFWSARALIHDGARLLRLVYADRTKEASEKEERVSADTQI